ncbi:uncharacterized protein [Cicer arietinum]|uniref:uncharacterized protein n=1 Tax=Cicer arietinum TaxID=3827 RepID=UPI003CC67689
MVVMRCLVTHSKRRPKLAKDFYDLLDALGIIVDFDEFHSSIEEVVGLLAGVCGLVATDSLFFPIGFDKWLDVPKNYLNEKWKNLFQARFCFKVNEDLAKRYIEASIDKKWRDYRIKLWDEFDDPTLSKNEIINNKSKEVPLDHLALFVKYRSKPQTKTIETGKTIGQGLMWKMTHKKKYESYVNDKAMEIGEKIDHHVNYNLEASSEISPNDASNVGSELSSPNDIKRSSDASNVHGGDQSR